MKQVNFSEYVDGSYNYWMSDWSSDGYVGKLTDTVYMDGSDTTNWCLFVGTEEECREYIASKEASKN